MLLNLGLGIIVFFAIFIAVAVWQERITGRMILILTVMAAALAVVVTNLPKVAGLVIHWGEKQALGFRWHEVQEAATTVTTKAEQVRVDVEEIRKLKERIAELVGRVERSEQNICQVVEVQTPRSLSAEQKQTLVEALSPFRGQKAVVKDILNDERGRPLAEGFVSVFVQAGWDLGEKPGVQHAVFNYEPAEIEILLNQQDAHANRLSPAVFTLGNTLVQLGILREKTIMANPYIPSGVIEVRIGKKLLTKTQPPITIDMTTK